MHLFKVIDTKINNMASFKIIHLFFQFIMLPFILISQVAAQIPIHDKGSGKTVWIVWRPLIIIVAIVAVVVVVFVVGCVFACLGICFGCIKDDQSQENKGQTNDVSESPQAAVVDNGHQISIQSKPMLA
ncbi:uncharacterized protein [Spinacia oleracea]|uniref:Uncharacterized protein n=1 Tax=Spinacia oleracea TaxID=3562 RepID=A0A9R0K012_SPIOL|nr:uncharacterized protein LOC110792155 [Spinacia oleracea]